MIDSNAQAYKSDSQDELHRAPRLENFPDYNPEEFDEYVEELHPVKSCISVKKRRVKKKDSKISMPEAQIEQ